MITFEFLIRKNEQLHIHADIELFYVMNGQLDFMVEDKQYRLGASDFLIVNADKKHSYQAHGEVLAVSMHISYAKLSEMLKQNMVFFWCNTVLEHHEMYEVVRGIIKKIISEQFHNQGDDIIYMNSLYFELLHVLTHDFVLNRGEQQELNREHKFDDRKQKISEYIHLNYDKPISLNDLAHKLFLSNAYLSKYIKRQFGMSFVDYVNSVRLNYAVSQLLHSDKSVVRIAMDTGFASSAALNKVFKEKYHMTPTTYRGQWSSSESRSHNTVAAEKKIQRQVARYFKEHQEELKKQNHCYDETAVIKEAKGIPLNRNWNQMINAGAIADLLHSDMQQHILQLKQTLGFKYVRIWDIYTAELFLDEHASRKKYNFSKLDRVLDFLNNNGLFPYIELGNKPKRVIQNRKKMLVHKTAEQLFTDDETIRHFISSLIIHLLNRYGAETTEQWFFELWRPETEGEAVDARNIEEICRPYLQKFNLIAGTLRHYHPAIRIGGGGLSLRHGEDLFRSILELWQNYEHQPDFLSVYSYPYAGDFASKDKNQSTDRDFLLNHLHQIRHLMDETGFAVNALHVSEWSFSVSDRNVLNDNCMKGAYLVKHMIDGIGKADILGYWLGSDLFADFYDSKLLLNGSSGLLTKEGIPKPAFYAFEFMNRLGRFMRGQGRHYAVTDNGHGNWRIICHNLKDLNYQYGLRSEDEISLYEQNNLFTDLKPARLHFDLPVQKNGTFQLRVYSVNQNHGSVQDEWLAMSAAEELNAEDITYLKRVVTPRLVIQNVASKQGRLVFDAELEPNEIQFIHARYQYI